MKNVNSAVASITPRLAHREVVDGIAVPADRRNSPSELAAKCPARWSAVDGYFGRSQVAFHPSAYPADIVVLGWVVRLNIQFHTEVHQPGGAYVGVDVYADERLFPALEGEPFEFFKFRWVRHHCQRNRSACSDRVGAYRDIDCDRHRCDDSRVHMSLEEFIQQFPEHEKFVEAQQLLRGVNHHGKE